jgi:chemotaxis protein MotA
MKAASAIGIAVAVVGILLSAMMEGTSPAAFIDIPAMIIVFAGTFGVTLGASGMERMKAIPSLYKRCFSAEPQDLAGSVTTMVAYAERARRDGLLALEDELPALEDAFTRKGLQLVVDGTDPDLVREILDAEIDAMSARHKASAGVFEKAGGFAPTMGIIGTVMGLVHVLANLSAPATLGPSISGAFIATLMGVGSANVVFLPIANRLKALDEEEVEARTLVLEGILAIQSGDNPRTVSEKLMSYVAPTAREAAEQGKAPSLKLAADPADQAAAA